MNKGFTLIETIVSISVFTIIMGAVSGLITMAYRNYDYILKQSTAIDMARKGIKTMVKEIREARPGDNGSYPIEKAENKEFIFYSDIDQDDQTERVRYFLGSVNAGSQIQECVTFADGGSCNVTFSNFLSGNLQSAQVIVSVEGDFGWSQETADISADGTNLGELCASECSDCATIWEGTTVFDITEQATDDNVQLIADSSSKVNGSCDWINPNHSMKVRFEFSWTEDIPNANHLFKKGVINPTGYPVEYPLDQEMVQTITSYVRNDPPIFKYFDESGQELLDQPARLQDTKVMELDLIVNINPHREPQDFEIKSSVQLRNLKIK